MASSKNRNRPDHHDRDPVNGAKESGERIAFLRALIDNFVPKALNNNDISGAKLRCGTDR
jgi:hypothetical protein